MFREDSDRQHGVFLLGGYMRHFDLEMNDLKKRLVDMAEIVQQMIKFYVDMIVKRDISLSK